MRRMVWVAVGAVGGIVVYRRAERVLADAQERGVVVSAQRLGMSAIGALTSARAMATGSSAALDPRQRLDASERTPGSAAARVLRQSKLGE